MSSASRRIHAADSPAENKDKYIDYVNRYYDMIQQEKLSNKKKVEEAIKRQNFDVDQIQATNASAKMDKSSSPPPTEPTPPFHAHPSNDLVVADQHNFRNAPRGDNFYPTTSPPHYCDTDKANLSMAMTPYKYPSSPPTGQRIADERSYEIVPTQAPVQTLPPHYDPYPQPSNYDYYPLPAPQRAATCTCNCFRPPNPVSGHSQIPRSGYDLRELAPTDFRAGNGVPHWHNGQPHFKYDKCGDNDYPPQQQHTHHPHTHYAAAPANYYSAAHPQHFNPPVEMHSTAAVNGYNSYFSAAARPPLVAKHAPCVYNVSSPLVPKVIQRDPPPQKPPSTSFMNAMRLEWEKNFNAARLERGNNILKNR